MSISMHPKSPQVFLVISSNIKKLLILRMNIVMCYFPQFVVLQGNYRVRGKNIDINKLEVRDGM